MIQKVRRKQQKKIAEVFIEATAEEMQEKVISIFRNHIGKDNSISKSRLFYELFGKQVSELDFYKAYFYMNKLHGLIAYVRKKRGIPIVGDKQVGLYVLKTYEEYKEQKEKGKNMIVKVNERMSLMRVWVREKKWRSF